MNNLTTRKITLGLLMVLVLAFGVLGNADAIDRLTRNSGDLQTVTEGRDYQIRFTVGLQSPRRGSAYTNYAQTPSASVVAADVAAKTNKTTYYLDDYDPDNDSTARGYQNEPQVAYDEAHDYEQESIAITVSGGTIKKVASYDVPTGTESLPMYERTHNSYSTTSNPHQRLSGSVTLTLTAPEAAAAVTITIAPTTDGPTGHVNPSNLIFTVYAVGPLNATGTTTASSAVERVSDQSDTKIDGDFTFNPAANEPVYYSVEGSGRLYVSLASDRKTSSTNNLYTSSSAPVYLDTNGGSSKVTAYIAGSGNTATVLYLFSGGTLSALPKIEVQSGSPQTGAPGGRLDDYFEVRVTDGRRRPVSGMPVTFSTLSGGMFIPVPGTRVYPNAPTSASIDAVEPTTAEATATTPMAPETYSVQTDQNGVAKIYYQLSDTPGAHTVTAAAYGTGLSATLTATASTSSRARIANLEIVSGNNQRADKGKFLTDDLVVIVRSLAGHRVQDVIVQFRTTTGTLVPSETTGQPNMVLGQALGDSPLHPRSGQQLYVETGPNGEAGVTYNVGQLVEARDIIAEIREEAQATTQYDFAIDRVTFDVNGGGTSSRAPADDDADDEDEDEDEDVPSVTIDVPTTVTGAAGGTETLTVTAPATARVTPGGSGDTFPLANAGSFTQSGTTYTSRLTLPNQVADYGFSVFVGDTRYRVTVSVTAAAQTGRLTVRVEPLTGAPGSTATVTVTTADSSAQPASVAVNLTATGGTLSNSSVTTGFNGSTTVTLTRGSTVGTENFVTVSGPSGYDSVSGRFVIAGPAPRDMTVGAAAELNVYDGNNQDGSLNSRLAKPFIVDVVDANDNPVENARVRFRTTIGSGRFSPRAFSRTDEDGLAEITFTPTSTGRIRVVATVTGVDSTAAFIVQGGEPADALVKVSGDDQSGTPGNALANPFVVEAQDEDGEPLTGHTVTFSVTAGGGSLSATSATTNANGRAQTTLTLGSALGVNSVEASVSGVDPVTFSTSIDAKILVAAANRPVMYWIAGGGLYSLSGAKEAKIAESANGVAVGGGKIYWTSQVNASSGTINSANLDGTGVATVTSIQSVPVGIAVDTAGSKLYWTNARGRIQSASLNGSSIQNVVQNLSDPTDIVVSNGFIYWTEGGNSVRRVNISGQPKITRPVATNLDSVGGLAVGGGKVYWTEMTSASAGTVNGADLDGTNFGTLATLLSAPMGISVDTAGSKLYWTNARGRVQSANLNGSMIKNVVEGLISPSKIAIGGVNTETETMTRQPTAKKDNAKYDVNGDGAVDNTDASLVAAAMNTSNTKYDVNGDGTVNFLDLLLVFDNREDAAAAAPTIVGMKLTAIQIDIIQEQIDLLIATNDRSPAALRTLVYMQQLLATARPEKTQLFANYPNPFNPETWIPYELATDTHVTITIYNTQGVVIRTLQFGHQSAGYYTGRDRAAYWDGRNALGEQVASGLYFYQLETDEMSSMRKMVILK